MIFFILAWRILGKMPANVSANFFSKFVPRFFRPCFSRVSGPSLPPPPKKKIQPTPKIHAQNCRHSSPIFGKFQKAPVQRAPLNFARISLDFSDCHQNFTRISLEFYFSHGALWTGALWALPKFLVLTPKSFHADFLLVGDTNISSSKA